VAGAVRRSRGGGASGRGPGRPKAGLALSDAERDQLRRWARGKDVPGAGTAGEDRAACAESKDNKGAAELRVTEQTVARRRGGSRGVA